MLCLAHKADASLRHYCRPSAAAAVILQHCVALSVPHNVLLSAMPLLHTMQTTQRLDSFIPKSTQGSAHWDSEQHTQTDLLTRQREGPWMSKKPALHHQAS